MSKQQPLDVALKCWIIQLDLVLLIGRDVEPAEKGGGLRRRRCGCLLWVLRSGRRCGNQQDHKRQWKQPGRRSNQRFTAAGSSRARATMRVESRMARVALAMLSDARETASTSTPTWNLSKMLLPLN